MCTKTPGSTVRICGSRNARLSVRPGGPHHRVAVVVDERAVVDVVVGGGAEAEQAEDAVPGVVHLPGCAGGFGGIVEAKTE